MITAVELMDLLPGQVPDADARVAVGPDDIAFLVYTSGTTGPAKGAKILHRSVTFNAEVFRTWMKMGPGDVILRVNNIDITSVKSLNDTVAKLDAKKPVALLIRDGNGTRFITFRPEVG